MKDDATGILYFRKSLSLKNDIDKINANSIENTNNKKENNLLIPYYLTSLNPDNIQNQNSTNLNCINAEHNENTTYDLAFNSEYNANSYNKDEYTFQNKILKDNIHNGCYIDCRKSSTNSSNKSDIKVNFEDNYNYNKSENFDKSFKKINYFNYSKDTNNSFYAKDLIKSKSEFKNKTYNKYIFNDNSNIKQYNLTFKEFPSRMLKKSSFNSSNFEKITELNLKEQYNKISLNNNKGNVCCNHIMINKDTDISKNNVKDEDNTYSLCNATFCNNDKENKSLNNNKISNYLSKNNDLKKKLNTKNNCSAFMYYLGEENPSKYENAILKSINNMYKNNLDCYFSKTADFASMKANNLSINRHNSENTLKCNVNNDNINNVYINQENLKIGSISKEELNNLNNKPLINSNIKSEFNINNKKNIVFNNKSSDNNNNKEKDKEKFVFDSINSDNLKAMSYSSSNNYFKNYNYSNKYKNYSNNNISFIKHKKSIDDLSITSFNNQNNSNLNVNSSNNFNNQLAVTPSNILYFLTTPQEDCKILPNDIKRYASKLDVDDSSSISSETNINKNFKLSNSNKNNDYNEDNNINSKIIEEEKSNMSSCYSNNKINCESNNCNKLHYSCAVKSQNKKNLIKDADDYSCIQGQKSDFNKNICNNFKDKLELDSNLTVNNYYSCDNNIKTNFIDNNEINNYDIDKNLDILNKNKNSSKSTLGIVEKNSNINNNNINNIVSNSLDNNNLNNKFVIKKNNNLIDFNKINNNTLNKNYNSISEIQFKQNLLNSCQNSNLDNNSNSFNNKKASSTNNIQINTINKFYNSNYNTSTLNLLNTNASNITNICNLTNNTNIASNFYKVNTNQKITENESTYTNTIMYNKNGWICHACNNFNYNSK